MNVTIHTKFNPPPKVDSPVGEQSMTDPQYAMDCDLNRIMRRNDLTGIPSRGEGQFIDTSNIGSFADNLRAASAARNQFEELPAHIRARFGGDPIAFYEFCSDDSNHSEMVRLGLIAPQPDLAPEVKSTVEPSPVPSDSHREAAAAPSDGSENHLPNK